METLEFKNGTTGETILNARRDAGVLRVMALKSRLYNTRALVIPLPPEFHKKFPDLREDINAIIITELTIRYYKQTPGRKYWGIKSTFGGRKGIVRLNKVYVKNKVRNFREGRSYVYLSLKEVLDLTMRNAYFTDKYIKGLYEILESNCK